MDLEKFIKESKNILLNEVNVYYTQELIIQDRKKDDCIQANPINCEETNSFIDFRKQLKDEILEKREKAVKTIKRWDKQIQKKKNLSQK